MKEGFIENAKKIAYKKGFIDGRKVKHNKTVLKLRRKLIVKMLLENGMTYEKVGFRFGITRQRVKQILQEV